MVKLGNEELKIKEKIKVADTVEDKCEKCNGSGTAPKTGEECDHCKGKGYYS
jgi:DnaJ-class molecular chaperone